jgi:hypothetical protein
VFLVSEKNFRLFGISQEHLQVEGLREQLLAVLPHLMQFLPAVTQGLEMREL